MSLSACSAEPRTHATPPYLAHLDTSPAPPAWHTEGEVMALRGGGRPRRGGAAPGTTAAAATSALLLVAQTRLAYGGWCAGGGIRDSEENRCPEDDAAGPCPPGCEVASASYSDSGNVVANVAIALVMIVLIGVLSTILSNTTGEDADAAAADVYGDTAPGPSSKGSKSPGKSPSGKNRVSISVENPMAGLEEEDDDIDME